MFGLFLYIGFGCWLDDTSYTEMAHTFQDWDQDGFTPNDGDCDDSDPMLHPDADEICDEIDNDCNDLVDDDPINGTLYYFDSNDDGCTDSSVLACDNVGNQYFLESQGC